MSKRLLSLLLVLCMSAYFIPSTALASNESTAPTFLFLGQAVKTDANTIQFTEPQKWQSGGVWSTEKLDLTQPMTLSFEFYMGEGNANSYQGDGADGISVSFTQTLPDKFAEGENEAFYGTGSFGVEYDTWYNSSRGDPRADHVAIIKDSVSNHIVKKEYSGVGLDDAQWHTTEITFEDGSLIVIVDGELACQYSLELLTSESSAYLGIAAATGDFTNRHVIRNMKINGQTVCFDSDVPPDFDSEIYRAKWMQKSEETAVAFIQETLSAETPSKELSVMLQETGFDEAIVAWKGFDAISSALDDPTVMIDITLEPKDMYSAIILNALEASVSYDIIGKKVEQAFSQMNGFVSIVENDMKALYGIDMRNANDFKNLTTEEKESLSKITSEWFDVEWPNVTLASDILSGLSKGCDALGNIENYFEHIVNCVIVANTSEYMKTVLRQAYQDSINAGNNYLRLALLDCVEIINSSSDELMLKIINDEFTAVGVDAAKFLFKELYWKEVNTAINTLFPAVAIFQQAYKSGKYVSNLCFSTEDTIEQYLNMLAVNDIENLIDGTVTKLNQQFLQENTSSTAGSYLSGIDLAFSLRDVDTPKAYGFVEILDNTLANKVHEFLSGKDNYTDAKSYYRIRQENYFLAHESVLTGWINSLDEDYPNTGLYEYYQNLFNESTQRCLQKEFVAACPVDLYIYNSNDELVASVEGDRVSCSGNVMIAKVNDTKIVRFYGDDNYRIEYIGNDTGEMDIVISEFDSNENIVRTVNFYDVPLEKDLMYTVDAESETLENNAYTLKEDGKEIQHDYDSLLTTDTAYNISVLSGTILQNGERFLSTTAYAGELLEVDTYIPEDYEFLGWTSNVGNDIFEDAKAQSTTIRMPASNVTIQAVLKDKTAPAPHPVSILATTNGTVTANPQSAASGDVVTLTASPDVGYVLSILTVTDENGEAVSFVDKGDNIYTFIMPEVQVTVRATFSKAEETSSPTPPIHSGSSGTDSTTQAISVPATTNGNITVNHKSAAKGTVVTLTATPDFGYKLSSLSVTDNNGKTIVLMEKGDGTYTFTMPASKVTVNASFIETETPTPDFPFTDVTTSAYYYDAVVWAVENAVTTGDTPTTFAPNAGCTRGQIVTFLWRAAGSPAPKTTVNPFTDVSSSDYYYEAVLWAVEQEITNGTSPTTFSPNDTCTRAHAVTFLYRNAGSPAASGSSPFTDVPTGEYYYTPVLWAVANGVTTGDTPTTFAPNSTCTRAQIVTFLYRDLA